MEAIKPLILIIVCIVALIAQNVYFLKDDREINEGKKDRFLKLKWHFAGAAIKGCLYFMIGDQYGIQYALLMVSATWFLYDGVTNTHVLNKGWFYVGLTDPLDICQQWFSKLLKIDVELLSAILKLLFVIATITTFVAYGRF